jgi:hypothetical protein
MYIYTELRLFMQDSGVNRRSHNAPGPRKSPEAMLRGFYMERSILIYQAVLNKSAFTLPNP